MSAVREEPPAFDAPAFDALVVGAGFAGLYMLHRLREAGFSAHAVEAGGGVGGTWYWNRYPGARCDGESILYSYSFSDDLQQEWTWSERYAAQPEILAYADHVADRFDLRRDISFDTRIAAARFAEDEARWHVTAEDGRIFRARHLVMATGCLSATNLPAIPGLERFAGDVHHTARWPQEKVAIAGRRIGVVGTGSSGIQVIPMLAREAAHLTVFQRTPNYAIPAWNAPLAEEAVRAVKANYAALRRRQRETPSGNIWEPGAPSALAVSAEERTGEYERRWRTGGLGFMSAYADLLFDDAANATAADFVRGKIRQIVRDPVTAAKLTPSYIIGCKRLCVDSGYYETFNRDNVTLVDVAETPIEEATPRGLRVGGHEYALDALVFATGFDAMTGALAAIDIRNGRGEALGEKWRDGPESYLGLMAAGFPNLFTITGPGSPSVLTNMVPTIEQHVEWITDCLLHLRAGGHRRIEAERAAEAAWVTHVAETADRSLRPSCNSWYVGANVPGKPRVFMPYMGGMPAYRRKCAEVAASGYAGFALS